MKVRKLAVALALAGGLGSGMAHALGLGEMELQSWLNEPLDAEITLRQSRGMTPDDVIVNVAPEAAYRRVGLERNQFLSNLKFEVVTGADGSLVIDVSSREPVREPYLNFLLELTWPNGRLLREYAVLVDPPVYAEESGIEEPVQAPATASQQASAPERSAESRRRQAQAEDSLSRSTGPRTLGPTGPSDTLWGIAEQVRPDSSVSIPQVMLAIQDENPDAFMGGNINRLKRGEVLRVPTMEQMRSRSRAEASRLFARQNEEFQSRQTVDATAAAPSGAPAGEAAGDNSELKLLVADNESETSRSAEEGGSAGGDGQQPGGADAGSAVAAEELDAIRRENEELSSRMEDLQDQVETLQRLLELKNTQLADMQNQAAQGDAVATDGPEAGGEGSDGQDVAGADAEPAESEESATTEAMESEGGSASETGESAAPEAGDAEATAAEQDSVSDEPETDQVAQGEGDTQSLEDAEPVAAEDPAAAETVADAEQPEAIEPEPEPEAEAPAPVQQDQEPPREKSFPGNIIGMILDNPMYQIALGGGLILILLVLMLIMRRRAQQEKAFYEQFAGDEDGESGEGTDGFDLSLDGESDHEQPEAGDPISEADSYLAYGRNEQAAQVLEEAISREPSRSDLRLKLLGVYADSQDREAFERQYGELAAFEEDEVMAQADELKRRLDEAEATPSIDDLESQLRSDSLSGADEQDEDLNFDDLPSSDDLKADEFESASEEPMENEFGELESEVAEETDARDEGIEFDLSMDDLDEQAETAASEDSAESEFDYDSLDFNLEGEDIGEPEASEAQSDETDLDLDDSLDLDLSDADSSDESAGDLAGAGETLTTEGDAEESSVSDDDLSLSGDGLDDSFLDELDAELDKVTGEEEVASGEDDSGLDDLDVDLSEEDLALMNEFSEGESDVAPEPDAEAEPDDNEIPSLDEEVTSPDLPTEEAAETGDSTEAPPEAAETGDPAPLDLDEADLGDDDDFDFLAGTDEAATKLDLARAYIEMGDSDGARDILEEVSLEGDDQQKAEAEELLKNLS